MVNHQKPSLLKNDRKRTSTSTQATQFPSAGGGRSGEPFMLPPSGGEKIWIVGDTMWLKATSADTGGAYTLIENIALPESGPPPHVHENEDESMYVIDGEFEILLGRQTIRAQPGAFAFVPKGTVHRFRCVSDHPGKILLLFSPGGIEGFFREAGMHATEDGTAPPLDVAEIARTDIARKRYGLRVIDLEALICLQKITSPEKINSRQLRVYSRWQF